MSTQESIPGGSVRHTRLVGGIIYAVFVYDAHTHPLFQQEEYVGRACPRLRLAASPLANPFRVGPARDAACAVALYTDLMRERLLGWDGDSLADANAWRIEFSRLLTRLRKERTLTLVCWCVDSGAPCHASAIACALLERVGKEVR